MIAVCDGFGSPEVVYNIIEQWILFNLGINLFRLRASLWTLHKFNSSVFAPAWPSKLYPSGQIQQ